MMDSTPKKHDLAALEQLYLDGESCDSALFAEMRSNLLLISGEHWQKKQSNFYRKIRDAKELSDEQKIRLTKNHTQNIHKKYCNHLLSVAPGTGFEPANENELQDQKAAELHHAVWRSIVEQQRIDEKTDDWADDFFGIGEVITKIFWDPNAGYIKSYEQKLSEGGAPLYLDPQGVETDQSLHESGQPHALAPGAPQYSGSLIFEKVHGFNLLRPSECKDMAEAEWKIIRKMVNRGEMLAKFQGEDKKKLLTASPDRTFVVFDAAKGGYRKTENELMLKEIYFRPCALYPKGYFYFWVDAGILAEGELPGGIFPIVFQACEKIQTTPRGRSIVKHMRPYQVEINRTASKIAEHQITLGDDKLLIQNGTTVTAGAALPGVRALNYTGAQPVLVEGRTGEQYLNYLTGTITEMYQVMNVAEETAQTKDGQMDPYGLLFRAASQKKAFSRYVKRFERYLCEVTKTGLKLAKIHLPEDTFIQMVGKKEAVNIAEFRSMDDLCYQIQVTPQSEDVESKLGKQLILNHALQYVGNKLDKEDIGKLMRAMPYSNFEESFNDLTMDYDSATNDILALDRGEIPQINEYDNHVYVVKRLVARMRQADFKTLNPSIQANYQRAVMGHQQAQAIVLQKMQRLEQGFIPTGGYMVTIDLYVSDPKDPLKTRRARVPYQSLEWLIKQLEAQGQSLDQLEAMNQGALAQLSDHVASQPGMPMGPSRALPAIPIRGKEMPPGEMSNEHGSDAVPASLGRL
jgi:hypothetical protein